jgi:hypothetical protein
MYQSTAHVGARPTTAQVSAMLISEHVFAPLPTKLTAGGFFDNN